MKNQTTSNMIRIIKFYLGINKKFIIVWSVVIFAFMTLYMALFPSIKDMATDVFETMPKELMQFFSMEDFSSVDNYIIYFGMIFNLVLIAISVFAATLGASLIQKDEKNKTIELLNSLSVTRGEIYFSKYIVLLISILFVLFSGVVCALIFGYLVGGETFVLYEFFLISDISSFSPFFFGTLAFGFAGATTKISVGAVSSGVVFGTYMFGFLSKLLGENGDFLKYLSPLELFGPENAVAYDTQTLISLAIYLFLLVMFAIVGSLLFKKRDLNI